MASEDLDRELNVAVRDHQPELIAGLLAAGADPYAAVDLSGDGEGVNAVERAAMYDRPAAIRALALAGVNLDYDAAGDGWRAIHYASRYCNTRAVEALLAAGADARALTSEGRSAVDVLRKNLSLYIGKDRRALVVALLEAAGAKATAAGKGIS